MLTKMVVLTNRQLPTDYYIDDLNKKLAKVESEWSALRDKLVVTKEKLKGSETALELALDQLEGEKAGVAVLHASLDEVKVQCEVEKEKAANEVVTKYMESEAFNDETTKFFINGFEALHRQALRIYPNLDLFMLKIDAESDSVQPELVEVVEE